MTASSTRSASRTGSGEALAATVPKITAGLAEHVADVAPAVVDPVQNRLSEVHEAPHQLERQVGALPGHLVEDELALLVEVLHEGRALLPVDDGVGLAQRGEPLADGGRDRLGTGLGAELEPQPPLDHGIPRGELEQDLSQPAWRRAPGDCRG